MEEVRAHMPIESLSDEELGRLNALAKARDESAEAVLSLIGPRALRRCPRRFSNSIHSLRSLEISGTGSDGRFAWLQLPNGRVFYGYKSHPKVRREFNWVKDTLQDVVDEDSFLVALDVASRYATAYSWPPAEMLPQRGGTVIEAGAYLGHKTVRFVDQCVGNDGNVLAVEMVPENVELLQRNVSENGLDDTVKVVSAGVWKECDELPVRGKGRQRNSLTDLSHINEDRGFTVPVQDLDTIIENWGKQQVDLLFVSVNGVELEALEGLQRNLEHVRALFIVAPYERDGRRSEHICRELLAASGCSVLPSRVPNQIAAWGPRFRPS